MTDEILKWTILVLATLGLVHDFWCRLENERLKRKQREAERKKGE